MSKKKNGGTEPQQSEPKREEDEQVVESACDTCEPPDDGQRPCEVREDGGAKSAEEPEAPEQGGEQSAGEPQAPEQDAEEPDALGESERLAAELDEVKDRLLRTAAEYDNFRKRSEREKSAAASLGEALVIEKLLPALDTLEMAVGAECSDPDFKKGVEMTAQMFKKSLADIGVSEIEAEGLMFDPALHNAVSREGSELESGTVTRVLQKGYRLGERVIRHAMVSVAE